MGGKAYYDRIECIREEQYVEMWEFSFAGKWKTTKVAIMIIISSWKPEQETMCQVGIDSYLSLRPFANKGGSGP